MKVSIHKRKRILLLFVLGIGLPSLLLGYLAFRGIQNDRALLEKEKLSEQRRISESITALIDESILEVEQAFQNAISNRPEISLTTLVRSLESIKNKHPLVEEVFFYQNLEKIRFPAAKFLFIPDGSGQSIVSPSRASSLNQKVKYAQQLEFQKKDYKRALINYLQALKLVSDLRVKAELLSAAARVQKKSLLFKEAIKSYEIIARDFSRVQVEGGIPLGLAARSELGSLFMAIDDPLKAIKTFIELYEALIHREWTLEKAQYEFFVERTKESINKIFSKQPLAAELQPYRSTFEKLEEEERTSREITDRLIAFQESAATDLQAKVPENLDDPRHSVKRFTLDIGKHTYLISLLNLYTGEGSRTHEIWGLLLDADYLKDNLLRQALQRHVSSEEGEWIVRGKDGQVLLNSGRSPAGSATVKTNFAENFPPWLLELYQKEPHLLDAFLTSRRGVYFYMFLLIAGILVFGLILTVRSISHELELAKMKSDFVSTISHEFKSPLTSLRQIAEMLQSGRVPSEERRQQYYDVLLEQSERLSLLTDNILNLAKIEEGRKEFAFEKTDCGVLLQEVVSSIQDRVRHEGFHIELEIEDPLPVITADRAAITQAVANLIDNAIKYSGESKKVIVSSFREGPNLTIAVKDFGIGIKKDEVDKVFERFYRGGDELTRTVKGSGLGLTLVREIVEAHQGKVDVESELGKGSLFSIRLPISQREDK
jgi:signal transduction histidine kinase